MIYMYLTLIFFIVSTIITSLPGNFPSYKKWVCLLVESASLAPSSASRRSASLRLLTSLLDKSYR